VRSEETALARSETAFDGGTVTCCSASAQSVGADAGYASLLVNPGVAQTPLGTSLTLRD